MFEMRAGAAVFCYGSPFVVQDSNARSACIDHWLDSKHHAFAQFWTVSANAVVRHLRVLVQFGSNSVSHELSDHAESVRFHDLLYGGADVANGIADAGRFDSPKQRLLGDFQQLAKFGTDAVAYRNRDRRISVVAVKDDAAVDRNDVPFTEGSR